MANETFSEKVSVNMNSSTLSNIDLLVDHGFYSNRSDFINQAVRTALQQHQSTLDRIIDRNTASCVGGDPWFVGVYRISRREIEDSYRKGESYTISGYGVLILEECPEEMVFAVIKDIRVKGKTVCQPAVKKKYNLK